MQIRSTRIVTLLLGLAIAACTNSAPTAQVAGDPVCRPPTHQCPKCGPQGGTYCGSVCLSCPVTEAPPVPATLELAAVTGQQCGGTVCSAGLHCCNPSCSICTPKGVSCTQQSCN